MASARRIEKLNSLLREELAKILERESEFRADSLMTVTRVSVSSDLQYAAVYISLLSKDPKKALQNLKENVYNIQQTLNRRLRMRPVPKVYFVLDEAGLRRERIEKSLAELKKKGEV